MPALHSPKIGKRHSRYPKPIVGNIAKFVAADGPA